MDRYLVPRITVRQQSTLSASLRKEIQKQLSTNVILKRIWEEKHNQPSNAFETYNALNTLPLPLKSKSEVFEDTRAQNPDKSGFSLQLKQYGDYTKALLGFYKTGIKNVWSNGAYVRSLKKKYYVEQVGAKGAVTRRQLKNGQDLVEKIAELRSLGNIERSVTGESKNVLAMTRSEFQTVIRTEKDFFKIPMFTLVLMIFVECTPFICYLFPEITPSTCVLPNLNKKLHNKANMESFNKLRENDEELKRGKVPVKNYENLPIEQVRELVKVFRLKHRLLPIGIFPDSILRQRLKLKLLEFEIDNDFLIKGLWSLDRSELLKVCLDRGLVFGLEHTDHELRLRLIQHLSNVDGTLLNCNVYGLNYLENENNFTFTNFNPQEAKEILELELATQ